MKQEDTETGDTETRRHRTWRRGDAETPEMETRGHETRKPCFRVARLPVPEPPCLPRPRVSVSSRFHLQRS